MNMQFIVTFETTCLVDLPVNSEAEFNALPYDEQDALIAEAREICGSTDPDDLCFVGIMEN